jgi:ppGpp synthetase/RelA/SpoT-type nucleotidyltranferase
MTLKLRKTQIDRLGDRLRKGSLAEAELRSLDEYRRSFGEAYESTVRRIRERLQLEPSGRPAKSTASIVEKLLRESIRLTQIQDIAGCRIVVANTSAQDRAVASLLAAFPAASVVDRRASPSHGYRAVHVIVQVSETLVEVQVRSALQHRWAEMSEKLSDVHDPKIKYGGGPSEIQAMLMRASEGVETFEAFEVALSELESQLNLLTKEAQGENDWEVETMKQRVSAFKDRLVASKTELFSLFDRTISLVENFWTKNHDLSD